VLVDGDARALRAGQLSLVGARAATDAGQRVRGWRLDLAHPWKRTVDVALRTADVTDQYVAIPMVDEASLFENGQSLDQTLETQALTFAGAELSTAEVLQIVEATADRTIPPASRQRGIKLAERLRRLANGDADGDSIEALAQLRRARADAEGGPAANRCQAALALALALTLAGRSDEALLDALDALARAREIQDAKAVGACLALLAKLYSGAGREIEAIALRGAAGVV
jgi:hypothetical protein